MAGSRIGMADRTETLTAMKVCRDAMIRIAMSYPSRDPIARDADWLLKDIDNLAGIIAGKHDLVSVPRQTLSCAGWPVIIRRGGLFR